MSGGEGGPEDRPADPVEVNRELEAKLEELARANLELYEMARQKSEFVANMSHELRTPLNSIIGFADVLLEQVRGSASEEQIRYLQNIRRAGYRLLELLSEVMTFARIEAGTARANIGPVCVQAVVCEVATNLQNGLTKRLDISVEVAPEMPVVMTDEVKLAEILQNLGANAVKFTPEGGCISLRATLEDRNLVISVADTGVGIPEKEREAIFKRFFQSNSGVSRRHEGMGLGLYIVDRLVSVLRGRVGVESAPGKGSKFTVIVPVGTLEE